MPKRTVEEEKKRAVEQAAANGHQLRPWKEGKDVGGSYWDSECTRCGADVTVDTDTAAWKSDGFNKMCPNVQ